MTRIAKPSDSDKVTAVAEDSPWVSPKEEIATEEEETKDSKTFYLCFIALSCTVLYFIFVFNTITPRNSKLRAFSSCNKFCTNYEAKAINFNYVPKKGLIIEDKKSYCPRVTVESSPFRNFRIVCYYVIPSNATHSRQLPPNYVDPYLCTHIIVGFAGIDNGSIAPGSLEDEQVYKTMTAFKNMNPSLKVMLSVSEFSSNGQFGKMVADKNLRAKFSSQVINFLESMNFDGIDLDWEFPSWPNPDEEQKKNFSLLLQNIRKEIIAHDKVPYILSVAVGAPEAIIDQSYQITDIARYADFINLMSYDYHMYTEYLPLTGPNSPVFPRPQDKGLWQSMNVNWSAFHWNECGMPLEKINIGIPTYGHSFNLVNEDNNGWNAPADGFGKVGNFGFTSYPDACHFSVDPDTNQVFDEHYLVPYMYKGKEWVSYDNTLSVEYKAKFIKENKFGGAMIYSLNSDDFYGECGTLKFPLLRQITNILSNA